MRRLILEDPSRDRPASPDQAALIARACERRLARKAPVSSVEAMTSAALRGCIDRAKDYAPLVEAWKQPLKGRGE